MKKIIIMVFICVMGMHSGEKKTEEQAFTVRYVPCCAPARIAVPPCHECYEYYSYLNLERRKQNLKDITSEKKAPQRDLP